MNDTQKIALNTAVQLAGKAVTVATSILIVAYLARSLGVEGYGDYATVFAYLGVFGVIVDLGLFITAVREIAKNPPAERIILGNMLGLKLALGAVVFGAAYGLSFLLPYPEIVRQGILLGAVSQFFISLNQAPLGSFQASLTMYQATLSDVAGRLFLLGMVWWYANHSGGLMEMIQAVVVANVIVFGLNILMVGWRYWLVPLFDLKQWKRIFISTLPVGLVMVLGVIYFRIDILMLAGLKGSFAVGIYSAPYKILEVLLAVPSIFMSSVLPVMTAALKRSLREAQRVFQRAFDFSCLAALPLIVGTVVVATPIMALIAGPEFILSGPVLKVLIFSLGASFLNSVMIYTLMAAEEQRRLIIPYIIAVIFNVAANLIFIPRFSYWGAAGVTVLTEVWVLIASTYILQKHLHLIADWRLFGKASFSSLVMGGLLYYWRFLPIGWLVFLGAAVYAGMIIITRAVKWNEITELIPGSAKLRR